MRVALVLRAAEVLPLFLWFVQVSQNGNPVNSLPPSLLPPNWLGLRRRLLPPVLMPLTNPSESRKMRLELNPGIDFCRGQPRTVKVAKCGWSSAWARLYESQPLRAKAAKGCWSLPPWSRHAEAIPHILWKLQGSAKGWPLSGSAVGKRLAFEWSSYCCCSLPSLLRWLWFKNNPVIETFQQLLDNQPGTVSRGEQHFSKSEIKRSLSWRILPQNFTKSEISTSFAYQKRLPRNFSMSEKS